MSTNTCNVGSKSQKFGYIGKIHEPIIGFEVAIRFVSSCKEDNRKRTYHGSRELEAFGFDWWNVELEGWSGFTRDRDATGCNAFFSSSIISLTMANVLHRNISFHPHPVSHAPSPFGFGFGLSSAGPSSMGSPSWGSRQLEPGHTNPAAFHQLASSIPQSASSSRAQKRRLDPEDDSELSKSPAHRDDSMDRSPTPERPKRAPPKRARVAHAQNTVSKDDAKAKKNSEEDHIDIGVLLGKLVNSFLSPADH